MFSDYAKKLVHELTARQKRVADVGLELEVEGQYLPGTVPHWNSKAEGSLQEGMEYITKPIKRETVQLYVDNLAKYFKDCNTIIKPSYRCSTHIHVNMSDISVSDMLGFVTVFTMFEPLLLALCGSQRNGNLFCLSNYDTGDAIQSFQLLCERIVRAGQGNGFVYDRGKYSALNLGRLYDLNTAEARCFPLSVKGSEVQKWVDWLVKMKDMAVAQPDKTYRELWKNVRQNPNWYAMEIFGADYMAIPNAASLIDVGTETAYEYSKLLKKFYSQKPKEKPEPKAKKNSLYEAMLDDYIAQDEEF